MIVTGCDAGMNGSSTGPNDASSCVLKLPLRPGCEGFDPRQLDQLVAEATGMMRASASPIDSIRIVPER